MSGGASIVQESFPRTANVAVHVLFGTLCLLLGLLSLAARKGGIKHIRFGRYFLASLSFVIATSVIGLLRFDFRPFLGVITLLAAYEGYAGYRAPRIRFTGPRLQDGIASAVGITAALLLIVYIRSVSIPWAPVITYSTLGSLIVVAGYDLARFAFPRHWFQRTWFYEHLVKMLGAYTAVVSAFSGTVFEKWQPYSQILPSILGTAVMIGYILYFLRRPKPVAIGAT